MEVEDVAEVIRVIQSHRSPKPKKKVSGPKGIPDHVTLEEILNSLPKEVFAQDRVKAYGSLLITLLSLSFSVYLLANTPWFVWPLAWIIGGASITGLFAIGHDCVHRAFAKSKIVNDIVGTILMLPLGYSYESWKTCHRYYNRAKQGSASNAFVNEIWSWAKGHTFWLASLGYWAQQHFDISYYKPEDRLRIRLSNFGVLAFGLIFFSVMFWYTGLIGIVKFWLLPWLGYHILISTTTLLPTVVLDEKSASTLVHLTYPKWLEFLTNDISITLPRSVSTSIPHYKLRKAYQFLKKQWGDYFLEINFDWDLLTELVNQRVTKEEFDPLPLKVLPTHGEDEEHLKSGDINPIPQATQGVAGWIQSAKNVLNSINWLHTYLLVAIPMVAFYGVYTHTPAIPTLIWSGIYYFLSGIGITAGYHRLWAHKAYSARQPTKFILLMLGTGAMEGSLRWWARDHRAHHRYTDTDKDPYNANRGFWYSHIGWMLLKQDPNKIGRANIEDLNADPWIRWQHKYYMQLSIFMSFIFPTLVCCIWNDFWGGVFYASLLRQFLVHHNTFLVNSLAHFWGLAPFADEHTPRDSVLTALLTFGEGYHNFHHEFPNDYRNATRFYQYDPTKWVIKALSYIGQTYDLKIFDDDIVKKGQIQMQQKELDRIKDKVDWGTPLEQLPVISRAGFDRLCKEGYKLIIINGVVHDISEFIPEHPGGSRIIEPFAGKDGTKAFSGGVYYHSNAARNLLSTFRVAVTAKNDNWTFGEVVVDETPIKFHKKDN